MTSSYKQKKQLVPKRFNLISLILLLFLLSLPFLVKTSFFLNPKKEIWQESSSLSKEEGFEISFGDFQDSLELEKETPIVEESPVSNYKEEEIKESLLEEREVLSPSEVTEPSSANKNSSTSKEEASVLEELAYELSKTFNKVKYYSSQSRKEKLEGESILLVKISDKGEILEVKRQDSLSGHLSEDLNYSIEKLKKSWYGKNKAKKEVTLQMKVTYKLI